MPANSGLAVAAVLAVVALVVYWLVWRATASSSRAMQFVVRGGLLILIAVPLAAMLVLTLTLQRTLNDSEPRVSAPDSSTTFEEARRERERTEATVRRQAEELAAARQAAEQERRLQQPPRADESMGTSRDAAAAPLEWQAVVVFFGTDRQEQPDAKRLQYNSERGRRLELGRALVTVPKIHEVPNIERPWVVKIPYFDVTIYEQAEDPAKHFTMQELKKLPEAEFLRLARERLAASNRYKDHALVFVHGYNTSFDYAAYRTAQIAYDLQFDGAVFVYSWPSGGAVASYTYDRESAQAAEPYLRQFLDLVVKQTGAKSVSIIAHSMGNQPLLDVLKDMRSSSPQEVAINEVILAAPDVDADNFANVAQRIEGIAKGVTLYAASNDRALIVSRNFWRNPRAGDVPAAGPLIVPGIETIDITAASTDSFALNHAGYAENNDLLQDIGKLILSGLRPPDQRLPALRRTSSPKGDYWRYTAP
jgi:esterase/lipase superfamily enzyme